MRLNIPSISGWHKLVSLSFRIVIRDSSDSSIRVVNFKLLSRIFFSSIIPECLEVGTIALSVLLSADHIIDALINSRHYCLDRTHTTRTNSPGIAVGVGTLANYLGSFAVTVIVLGYCYLVFFVLISIVVYLVFIVSISGL